MVNPRDLAGERRRRRRMLTLQLKHSNQHLPQRRLLREATRWVLIAHDHSLKRQTLQLPRVFLGDSFNGSSDGRSYIAVKED